MAYCRRQSPNLAHRGIRTVPNPLQSIPAVALLLAAIAGALAMTAVGPARITRLRHTIRHALGKARTGG